MSTSGGRRPVTRGRVVLAVLVLGALGVGASALPWASVTVPTVLGQSTVSASGSEMQPVTTAASVAVLAAGLAVSLGGRWVVRVGAAAVALLGLLLAVTTVGFLRDPVPPLRGVAAQATGVAEITGAPSLTVWPYLTAALGVAVAVAGVLATRITTTPAGRRFERAGGAPSAQTAPDARVQAMDDWDALGRGEDPSAPDHG
ncbi:Trp biosynthesis-associated membrane protein [uncultured Georgenia sp.]|uniref:Trp biosynthesis-associated membrane protein n=1 Tax=uncultured Georgenia sp. TaxID=378209 RepID=UPI00261780BD|nr:Trp biosynthesis-associated membrane protein [uncultured Georgenia sp.]HLV05499.1 Trp biosynthesis-associated membrane protein [Actinomycetaceae bacterium]